MKKIYISIGIVLTLVLSTFTASAATIGNNQNETVNSSIGIKTLTEGSLSGISLIADGGSADTAFDVGYIDLSDDGSILTINYYITEYGWEMTLTHVHIGTYLDDFPTNKKGAPMIGHFTYQVEFDPPVTEYTLTIPYDGETMIAVHAEVQTICDYEADITGIEANLPDTAQFKVSYPYGGGPAYFPHTYINGIDGITDIYSWCVDTDHVIYQGTWYTANVYLSTETIPTTYIEHPENLDKVNWILSQGFVGTPSPGCSGSYTYGDVQRAIWQLVEDTQSTSGLGAWSQCRVNEILAGADTYGEGFIPDCGDVIGVILIPVGGQQVIIAQAVIGEIEVPCTPIYCDETAWAGVLGLNEFEGRSWAMYFYYNYTPENDSIGRGRLLEFIWEKIATILENLRRA